jgi:hypothetical protein
LEREYLGQGRSASDIATEHGVTENAILFWLTKHAIPRRTMHEVRRRKYWGSTGPKNPMHGRCGAKNPRWIDGSSPERQRLYAQSFWKQLVQEVYRRDGFRCRRCASPHTRRNRLHAHHVKPWAGHPTARFDLTNLLTVCAPCHQWIHSRENLRREFLSRGRHPA